MRRWLGIDLIGLVLAVAACSATQGGTAAPGASPVAQVSTGAPTAPTPRPAATSSSQPTEVPTMTATAFSLTSTAFGEGDPIPRKFTCDGENGSPDLTWSGAPDNTQALALVVTDPDARDFVHWLVFDLTGTPTGGLPVGMSSSPDAPPQGTNSFGSPGYGGPCPPSGVHHYRFTLYALDKALELTGAPRVGDVQAAMDGHVLATTTLTGTYHR